MINTASGKNKVFFALKFGFAPFYFYTFIGLGTGWGEAGRRKRLCQLLMFSARGKLPIINLLTRQDGLCRPFLLSCRGLSLSLQ
jgi:hypothetical protein